MDKSKYKVLIETAQQAFELKAILNFLGEKIDPKCFDFYDDYMYLIFHAKDLDWMLVNKRHSALNDREETSAKELVNMLLDRQPAREFINRYEDRTNGDNRYIASICRNTLKWSLVDNVVFDSLSPTLKSFPTKEAAEAWIAQQNKPKEICLKLQGGEAIITKDRIRVHLDAEDGRGYYMEATEIEPIYAAYKSLQSCS